MSISNNTNLLQDLLDAVNALPEAENLDSEISTQSTLISEQDAKIAELAEILSGKAGGSGSIEMCQVTFNIAHKAGNHIYFTNSNMESENISLNATSPAMTVVKEIPKNTIIVFHKAVKSATIGSVFQDSCTFLIRSDASFSL